MFPNDATLSVTHALPDEQRQADAAVDAAREAGRNVAARYTFDIKILDAEGNALRPAEGETVSVSFSLDQVADDNLTTGVYHIPDGGAAEKLDVTTEDEVTATVETDSFFLYTVELTYGALSCRLADTDPVALSAILEQAGLTGVAEWASASDASRVALENDGGAWTVTALQSFDDPVILTVLIDETEYDIALTCIAQTSEVPEASEVLEAFELPEVSEASETFEASEAPVAGLLDEETVTPVYTVWSDVECRPLG